MAVEVTFWQHLPGGNEEVGPYRMPEVPRVGETVRIEGGDGWRVQEIVWDVGRRPDGERHLGDVVKVEALVVPG